MIAVDGGYRYLSELGMIPDLVVGDFDSLGCVPEGVGVIKHAVQKNDRDMVLAVKLAFEKV